MGYRVMLVTSNIGKVPLPPVKDEVDRDFDEDEDLDDEDLDEEDEDEDGILSHPEAALTDDEKRDVVEFLSDAGARMTGPGGFYELMIPDGQVWIDGRQLAGPGKCAMCAVTLPSLGEEAVEFLFELMCVGNFALSYDFGMRRTALISEDQRRLLAGHLPDGPVCGTPEELRRELETAAAKV